MASSTHESTAKANLCVFLADQAVARINALERELKARVPNLKWCFIEPDTSD